MCPGRALSPHFEIDTSYHSTPARPSTSLHHHSRVTVVSWAGAVSSLWEPLHFETDMSYHSTPARPSTSLHHHSRVTVVPWVGAVSSLCDRHVLPFDPSEAFDLELGSRLCLWLARSPHSAIDTSYHSTPARPLTSSYTAVPWAGAVASLCDRHVLSFDPSEAFDLAAIITLGSRLCPGLAMPPHSEIDALYSSTPAMPATSS